MITLTDIHKIYGRGQQAVHALDGVSLHVPPGAIFGILGASGAGKSTLIRCVNLLERPSSGAVLVDGQDLTTLRPAELRTARQRIGMIFQHFNLLSSRTVAGNVDFPLEVIGTPRAERQARVAELLGLVGLSAKADVYPAQLSGGQKQRVGIARALAGSPRVLLCDEATSALDPETTRSILDLLYDLNRRLGLTILLITHEMGVVKQICDHVAILDQGRIIEHGPVAKLLQQPGSQLARALFPPHALGEPHPGKTIATLTFAGDTADQPLVSILSRQFALDVNILAGSVERLRDQRVGQLQVELSGEQLPAALAHLHTLGVHVEVQR